MREHALHLPNPMELLKLTQRIRLRTRRPLWTQAPLAINPLCKRLVSIECSPQRFDDGRPRAQSYEEPAVPRQHPIEEQPILTRIWHKPNLYLEPVMRAKKPGGARTWPSMARCPESVTPGGCTTPRPPPTSAPPCVSPTATTASTRRPQVPWKQKEQHRHP